VAQDVKYAKSHEWAKLEGDVATVGISDHAQVGQSSQHDVHRVMVVHAAQTMQPPDELPWFAG
jgi:glycine cleavage system H lipoate-binding protein